MGCAESSKGRARRGGIAAAGRLGTTGRYHGLTAPRAPPTLLAMPGPHPATGRLGVDIGGTFTDLVWVDDSTGMMRVGKLLTTPKDPAQAVEQGVLGLLQEAGAGAGGVRGLIHGTT